MAWSWVTHFSASARVKAPFASTARILSLTIVATAVLAASEIAAASFTDERSELASSAGIPCLSSLLYIHSAACSRVDWIEVDARAVKR